MRVEKIEKIEIPRHHTVTLKKSGKQIEVKHFEKLQKAPPYQKLNKYSYFDTRTGEIFDYKTQDIDIRVNNITSLLHSFQNLRDIINTNLVEPKKCRFITLTYAENMQDTDRLYDDVRKFVMRFKYYLKKEFNISAFEYINICEPQGRGAWHCHLLVIFKDTAPFIQNNIIANLWGNGFTSTKPINDKIDNIGAYFCAYFTDLEYNAFLESRTEEMKKQYFEIKEKEVQNDDKTTEKKNIVKGGRLYLYPSYFKFFRTSRGIERPVEEKMVYAEAIKKAGSRQPTFSKTVLLKDDNDVAFNTLTVECYNLNSVI